MYLNLRAVVLDQVCHSVRLHKKVAPERLSNSRLYETLMILAYALLEVGGVLVKRLSAITVWCIDSWAIKNHVVGCRDLFGALLPCRFWRRAPHGLRLK